ncbi:unnamed protein product [Phytophthora fragariaefolia]|uniref:Unnamed protein product n=1 Tax=Phytophthora fragariaefolia TaxID=1490495 RepID=A0A9W6YE87_9STRA|nr:unnamed protein product [Phytophthora fragariaefolia]
MCTVENCTSTKNYMDDRCYRHRGKQHAKPANVEENIVEAEPIAEVMPPIPHTYITEEIVSDETAVVDVSDKQTLRCIALNNYATETTILTFKEYARAYSTIAKDMEIDHQYFKNHTVNADYPHVLRFSANDANDSMMDKRYYYFKSEEDRNKFESIKVDVVDYCIKHELYDQRLVRKQLKSLESRGLPISYSTHKS